MVGTSIGLKIELDKTASIASFPKTCFPVFGKPEGLKASVTCLTIPVCAIRNHTIKLDIRTDLKMSLIHGHNFFNICPLDACHFALDKRLVIF